MMKRVPPGSRHILPSEVGAAAVMIIALLGAGCYSIRLDEPTLSYVTDLASIDTSYTAHVVRLPSVVMPVVCVGIEGHVHFEANEVKCTPVYREEHSLPARISFGVVGATIVALGVNSVGINMGKWEAATAVTALGGYFIYVALDPSFGTSIGSDKWKFFKVDTVKTGVTRDSVYGEVCPRMGRRVLVTINAISHTYEVDRAGRFYVHLLRDFRLYRFESPDSVRIDIRGENLKLQTQLLVDPRLWTSPFFRTRGHRTQVLDEQQRQLVELYTAGPNEVLRVVSGDGPLVKVAVHGSVGYVPRDAGSLYWAYPLE